MNSKAACGGGSGGGGAKAGGDSGDDDGVGAGGAAARGYEDDAASSEAFAGTGGESALELGEWSVPADASASNALFCFMMTWYSSREMVPSARLRFAFSSASATPSPVAVDTRNEEDDEGPNAASEWDEGKLLVAVGSALVVVGGGGGGGARAAAAPEASLAGTKCAAQVS